SRNIVSYCAHGGKKCCPFAIGRSNSGVAPKTASVWSLLMAATHVAPGLFRAYGWPAGNRTPARRLLPRRNIRKGASESAWQVSRSGLGHSRSSGIRPIFDVVQDSSTAGTAYCPCEEARG